MPVILPDYRLLRAKQQGRTYDKERFIAAGFFLLSPFVTDLLALLLSG